MPVFFVYATPQHFPEVGKLAPSFSLTDTQGTLTSLFDFAYSGRKKSYKPQKVVVLDFFRTDCTPCRASRPKLIALHNMFKNRAFKVILIALLEENDGKAKLENYLKTNPVPFTVLTDTYGVVAQKYIAKDTGFELPMLFVIDRNGVLKHRSGFLDTKAASELTQLIEALLK